MIRNLVLTAVLAASLSGVSAAAGASTLFGTTYTGSTSDLYTIDQTTGAATLVGATGHNIGDLTNVGGGLVGIDLTSNALVSLNSATGAATGTVAITGTRGAITSVAWDNVTHVLYGDTTNAFSGSDLLYTIDTTTGAATLVGALGATDLFGLGFGGDGALFASDTGGSVYGVNTTTGAASVIGASGFFNLYDVAARPEDHVLFASSSGSGLITIDKVSGAGALVGPFGGNPNIAGLAFAGGSVPEPAAWTLMIAGFAAAGAMLRTRRRTAAAA